MSTDFSRNARTSLDREYAYMAYGMIGGAVAGTSAILLICAVALAGPDDPRGGQGRHRPEGRVT